MEVNHESEDKSVINRRKNTISSFPLVLQINMTRDLYAFYDLQSMLKACLQSFEFISDLIYEALVEFCLFTTLVKSCDAEGAWKLVANVENGVLKTLIW